MAEEVGLALAAEAGYGGKFVLPTIHADVDHAWGTFMFMPSVTTDPVVKRCF